MPVRATLNEEAELAYGDEEDEAEMDDPELRDEAEMDLDDGDEHSETIACPYCRKPVYEQAEICSSCGKYIASEDSTDLKPLWFILGVVVCVAVILLLWTRGSR